MQNQSKQKKALILGATGGLGSEVTRQLINAGWHINALKRSLHQTAENDNITWFQGDAMNQTDVENAAKDCCIIVHAVNPPSYKNWGKLVLPMLDNTITVAKKIRACIVFPGNVYNFGQDAFPLLHESSPQNPTTRKGHIRVAMESRLQHFAEQGGQVIIVRAGDFFGPNAGSSWFAQALIKPNKPVKSISNPSKANVGHQWAYLPDVANIMVKLIEKRESLDAFSRYHMRGFWDKDSTQMVKAIRRVVEKHTHKAPKITTFPWWMMPLITPFNESLREVMEMKYLWQQSIQMDNSKLVQQIGKEPNTPIDEAIEDTLKGLNCLN